MVVALPEALGPECPTLVGESMTLWRSRQYLDLSYVEGKTCLRCGKDSCEPCHYSGMYSDRLGKGGAQKSFDAAVADLCRECHIYFDLYEGGNDDARAAEFLVLCLETLHRNLLLAHAYLEPLTCPVRREGLPEKGGGASPDATLVPPSRRRKSRCTRSSKTIERGNRIV